jgi:HAD superfamily hydrolase (TIGR01548 family)
LKVPSAVKFPTVIIFDVDGVLVDTRGSFQQTTLETVKFFTGKTVTLSELHRWKNLPGYNDDWKLSTAWVRSLGGNHEYDEVKSKFVELYWGANQDGNVRREKWMLPRTMLKRLAAKSELAIFTGRNWNELDYTLDRNRVREFFSQIITVEEVKLGKPDPEGLLKILNWCDASDALYIGDNVDDAIAAQAAHMPFVGVLPSRGAIRRFRIARLRELGALTILPDIKKLQGWLSHRSAGARLTKHVNVVTAPSAHETARTTS